MCIRDSRHGEGTGVFEGVYPRNLCCCSGVGKAWGGPSDGTKCELCPRPGTETHTELCPKVSLILRSLITFCKYNSILELRDNMNCL